MATSDSKEDVPIFKCPLCLERLKTPRSLPCLHSFCELCIQSLLKSSCVEKEHGYKAFECPVCRTETVSPEPNMAIETWSSKFPINQLILNLEDQRKEQLDIMCDPCSWEEESNPAKYRCKDCRENICEKCYVYHRRFKVLRSHTVFDISGYSPCENVEICETCDIHENRDIDVFCFDHESLCCSMCSLKTHKMCPTVKTLDEIVEKEDCTSLNDLVSLIDSMSAETTSVKQSTKENIEALEQKQASIIDIMSSHIDEVKDKLDQLRDQFEKKMNQTHFDEKQTLEIIVGNLSGFLTTLEECKQLASVVTSRGTTRQKFLTMQKLKMRISSHLRKIENLTYGRGKSDYVLEKDESLETILNADQIGDVFAEFTDTSIIADIQQLFYSHFFQSSINDLSETTFRHTFEGVSKSSGLSNCSPIFKVRNIPWIIKCGPKIPFRHRTKYLGVYLKSQLDLGGLKWSCDVEFELRIINHIVTRDNVIGQFRTVFTNFKTEGGSNSLVEWDRLLDTSNGFVSNDKITLEVQVKANKPTGPS